MEWAAPEHWPLGVAVGVFLILALLVARRRRGVTASTVSILLRAAACAALMFYLLEPVTTWEETSPGTVLAAVDLSRSVPGAARAEATAHARASATEAGAHFLALGFGEAARPLPDAAAEANELLHTARDLTSDPLPALSRLLLRPEAAGDAARLLLVTDGALPVPPGDLPPAPALRPLVVPTLGGGDADVRAQALEPAQPPALDEPVQLVLRGSAARPAAAELVVHGDGREVHRAAVSLEAGEFSLPITLPSPTPGTHLCAARLVVAGDDPLDNTAACVVSVSAPPRVLVVSAAAKPLATEALRVQGLEVTTLSAPEFLDRPAALEAAGVVVLDRVPSVSLSAPETLAALRRHVERGGGLLYLPSEAPGEMFDAAKKPFLAMLPLSGREPPPPAEPEKPEAPPPDPGPGLEPPDPEARTTEKRLAPTLGLLLLIDSSSSMKGETLALAKAAAVAAAEVLHPEDHVCVVAFNSEARVVLELTRTAEMAIIRDRISRIQARGGTHFGHALERARDVFEAESLAIKHVILLSDGESALFPLEPLVKDMTRKGITVSTVGCGPSCNEQVLSDIAAWGRGKFQPAFNPQEIPQVFTIEAERVIQQSGARGRRDAAADRHPQKNAPPPAPIPPDPAAQAQGPPPGPPKPPPAEALRPALPAPYLRGLSLFDVPGLAGHHLTTARPGAWVALQTEGGDPVLAHGFLGYGRVLAMTAPLEGPWAVHLVGWDDYQVFLAQMVRFLHPVDRARRWHVETTSLGRAVEVRVADRKERVSRIDALELSIADETGSDPPRRVEGRGSEGWVVRLDPSAPAAALRIAVSGPGGDEGSIEEAVAFAIVEPPPEVRTRGLSLPGLEAWARSLGGEVAVLPAALDVPRRRLLRVAPWGRDLLPWLLPMLLLDLVLKRLVPGRRARRERTSE